MSDNQDAALALPADLMANRLPPRLLTVETCGGCRFRHKEPDGDVVCRRHSPQVTVLLVPHQRGPLARPGPNGAAMTELRPAPFCSFPLINDNQWCGDWEAKR